jgi:hypothetical protein
MAELPTAVMDLIASGTPLLNVAGFALEVCTEAEVDGVQTLSLAQKNALKMAVRRRDQSLSGTLFYQTVVYFGRCDVVPVLLAIFV